jgi:hypothetical protein
VTLRDFVGSLRDHVENEGLSHPEICRASQGVRERTDQQPYTSDPEEADDEVNGEERLGPVDCL